MAFAANISNEAVAALEAVQFDGQIEVVENAAALDAACDYLSKESLVGFDTETRPSFTAGVTNKVSLLQLSGGDRCFLIRLNRVSMSRKLLALLQNPAIEKIGAAVQNDIVSLNALRRFKACGFVDLQSIVSDYGIEDKSLRKISGIVLGKKVSKAQRLSNWEAKTLTPQQQMYAATDAWVCVEIYKRLKATKG
ncbi:MAG: 3'-5' exonuclease domain-containing protein 2 [Alistipes sp.]|jgi:ribonuclease D|nr:3'-5' exonuclease domain-containing protein 2 [Alistipes sp.]